jgi:hypothetical protein
MRDISMLNGRTVAAMLFIGCCIVGVGFAQASNRTLADDWNDFLHYTKIGRFDLAKGYAQAILNNNPDAAELFALSRENPRGYELALRVAEMSEDQELVQLTDRLLGIIDEGRFMQRTDARIIVEEIRRLAGTPRAKRMAIQRLKDAGEYAVPHLLDAMAQALRTPASSDHMAAMIEALPQIGRPAIRPLAASLQMDNEPLKTEVIRALGAIGYPQSLAYLKHVAQNDPSMELRQRAVQSIQQIDPQAANTPAAALFFQLGERYYVHHESLAPQGDAPFANIWFWDTGTGRLARVEVDRAYFHELMAMRCCEWSLRAEQQFGPAIGLWLASFFKAEATGVAMPEYFGPTHADALVYATTAGPEYLHQALARALDEQNAAVALGAVEALAVTAGETSLMYTLGPSQPLLQSLSFPDRAVRYSAALAIANAGPREAFNERGLVVQNLAEALGLTPQEASEGLTAEQANAYTLRAAEAMLKVAVSRNPVIDLSQAQAALIAATKDARQQIQVLAGQILAYLASPNAQRAIAEMALNVSNDMAVRIAAFESLAGSAKVNGNLLADPTVDQVYTLISAGQTNADLRAAAAAAYGALNLPSEKVKDLILDQAKS